LENFNLEVIGQGLAVLASENRFGVHDRFLTEARIFPRFRDDLLFDLGALLYDFGDDF